MELDELVRGGALPQYTGLQRTALSELEDNDQFPPSVPLTDSGRAKAYLKSEIRAWQLSRIAKRDGHAGHDFGATLNTLRAQIFELAQRLMADGQMTESARRQLNALLEQSHRAQA
jgi:predicted DNA-binding transcriptional regulator AlpA